MLYKSDFTLNKAQAKSIRYKTILKRQKTKHSNKLCAEITTNIPYKKKIVDSGEEIHSLEVIVIPKGNWEKFKQNAAIYLSKLVDPALITAFTYIIEVVENS